MDPYVIIHDKCTFVDQQTIKLQEAPDMVPVGELPRHVLLSADRFVGFLLLLFFFPWRGETESIIWIRYLTGRVIPGTRVIATGIYSTFAQGGAKVRSSFTFLSFPFPPLSFFLIPSPCTPSQKGQTVALRTPYLRILGLEIDTDGRGRGARNFTAEEEEEFGEMARGEGFYESFSKSIAPSIFGSEGAWRAFFSSSLL